MPSVSKTKSQGEGPCFHDVMFSPQRPQVRRCPPRLRPRLPSAIPTSLRKARSTLKIRRAPLIRGRKTWRSGISCRRRFLHPQPTLPAGRPHSLQGLGSDGCEFVICFDCGAASEFNTLLVTDWFAHTPPSVLANNFGEAAETFAKIPLHDRWIFQGKVPGDLLSVRKAMT